MSSTDWDQYALAYDAQPDHGLLAEAGHQVTFVDSSLEMTKLAKKKLPHQLLM